MNNEKIEAEEQPQKQSFDDVEDGYHMQLKHRRTYNREMYKNNVSFKFLQRD